MSVDLQEKHGVRLAIEGCGHGTLHAIYASVTEACSRQKWPGVDLLIICGDFQSVRNAYDLNCVSMPAKYRSMCDFHEYYSGKRKAPYLTIFVGGNHEASNYLYELYYGGWVSPNIYYMGAANVLTLGPLRIAGMSGIWKGYNYRKPHHERLPYNESDMRSIYHTRELDVRKLLQLRSQVDIGISHDWPNGVEKKGNYSQLMRFKPHLEADSEKNQLGSVAANYVMDWLRPKFWFSAHLHCKYAAIVRHGDAGKVENISVQNGDEIDLDAEENGNTTAVPVQGEQPSAAKNEDEIDLDNDDDDDATIVDTAVDASKSTPASDSKPKTNWPYTQSLEAATAALPAAFHRKPPEEKAHPVAISNETTSFLALDKCLPGKHFLQLTSVETKSEPQRPLRLGYDREWLAITRAFALSEPLVLAQPDAQSYPAKQPSEYYTMIDEQRTWVDKHLTPDDLVIPENFGITSPVFDGGVWSSPAYTRVQEYPDPQTEQFCQLLQFPNPFAISEEERAARLANGPVEEAGFDRKPRHNHGGARGGRSRGHFGRGGRGGSRQNGRYGRPH